MEGAHQGAPEGSVRTWMQPVDTFLRNHLGWMPARIALGAIAWFGFINLYTVRMNLSVAIVAMVKSNTSSDGKIISACSEYLNRGHNETVISFNISGESLEPSDPSIEDGKYTVDTGFGDREEGEMYWDETIQGFVLGSFFYGYALTQILGGRLAELYGTKVIFGVCIAAGGISSILSPVVARYHYGALIALRMIQGMFQGMSWPSMHACISRWIPPIERTKFIAIVYFATNLSSALTLPIGGIVIDNHGWPAVFYLTGILSLVWCIFWFAFMHDSPETHPRISQEELNYIRTAIKESGTGDAPSRIPWREIFKSPPVWALFVTTVGGGWGISLFISLLPTYMKNVLGFSMRENGIVSALPFLSRYIGGIMWGSLSSWIINKKYLSITAARKVFCGITFWGPPVMITILIFAGCNWKVNVALMCIGLFFNGAASACTIVNHTDLAPNFSGTLMGIDSTIWSVIAFVVPVVTGVMTDGQQTVEAWQGVFWICVPMYFFAGLFYLIFASGEVQPWNNLEGTRLIQKL